MQGIRIAAVTGIDLHTIPENKDVFTTYAVVKDSEKGVGQSDAEVVLEHICQQKTMVSKGPLFCSEYQNGEIHVTLAQPGSEGMLLQLKEDTGAETVVPVDGRSEITICTDYGMKSAVLKLYDKKVEFTHLLAVGAPIYTGDHLEEA